jgi:peptidoglycan/xylan/chitin deacetylase (PgdA/CDA1 family)
MALVAALMIPLILASPSPSSIGPTRPASPTGCAANIFELEMTATTDWGVVPFRVHFSIYLRSSTDSVEAVWWDFENDGAIDADGLTASHTFLQPKAYAVGATVRTRERRQIETRKTVTGYTGILSLTFDDGCRSVYYEAMPVLEARQVAATAYVVPGWIRDHAATYMSWADLRGLSELGWDIGSHTMTHVSLKGVDDSTLQYELGQSRIELRSRGLDVVSFSLPYGLYDQHALEWVRMYYESCRAVGHSLNPPVEFADPYLLLSKTSQPWLPLESYMANIDSVAASGGWYVLNNHRVWPECTVDWCIETQVLAAVIDYAIASGLRVTSVRNALAYRKTLEATASLREDPEGDPPDAAEVAWAFGNPLDLPGTIEFRLPAPALARARLYDCAGRHVRDLPCARIEKSEHRISWDGLNSQGEPVASGTYYCVITLGGESHSSGPILIVR